LAQPQCKDLSIIVTHDSSPQQHINEIVNKVQRRFTKRLIGVRCLAYDERLRQLGLLKTRITAVAS